MDTNNLKREYYCTPILSTASDIIDLDYAAELQLCEDVSAYWHYIYAAQFPNCVSETILSRRIQYQNVFAQERILWEIWHDIFANQRVNRQSSHRQSSHHILDHKLLSDLYGLLTILSTTYMHRIKVIFFSSANPKFFVAHYDLHIFSAELPLPAPLNGAEVSQSHRDVARMLWKMSVISIAEINVQAFGAGNELLVQMDMHFAGPNTKLGSLEVGLGVFAGNGELQFMTKLLGRAKTLEYLLSSGTAHAEEAERLGWVNKSFPSVEAMREHVNHLAERIATFSKGALAATKVGVNEQAPSEEALNNDLGRFGELADDSETQRAVTEFLKRSDDQKEGEWELGLNDNLMQLWLKGSS